MLVTMTHLANQSERPFLGEGGVTIHSFPHSPEAACTAGGDGYKANSLALMPDTRPLTLPL